MAELMWFHFGRSGRILHDSYRKGEAICNPQLTYVEVELGDMAVKMMELYTGILGSCFWNCHPRKHVYCEF